MSASEEDGQRPWRRRRARSPRDSPRRVPARPHLPRRKGRARCRYPSRGTAQGRILWSHRHRLEEPEGMAERIRDQAPPRPARRGGTARDPRHDGLPGRREGALHPRQHHRRDACADTVHHSATARSYGPDAHPGPQHEGASRQDGSALQVHDVRHLCSAIRGGQEAAVIVARRSYPAPSTVRARNNGLLTRTADAFEIGRDPRRGDGAVSAGPARSRRAPAGRCRRGSSRRRPGRSRAGAARR